MRAKPPDSLPDWSGLFEALDFLQRRITQWQTEGTISASQVEAVLGFLTARKQAWEAIRQQGGPIPSDAGLPLASPGESAATRSLRYWSFARHVISQLSQTSVLPLSLVHRLDAEVREHQKALERRIPSAELPEAQPADPAKDGVPAPGPAPSQGSSLRRQNVLEILLDPRNIQWMLAFGGALMVLGIVILLWVNNLLSAPLVATGLGVGNLAVLGSGWWVLRSTRYQLVGRALTLLACLVMPLNLWYYHTTGLVTLDGHLWLAAVAISACYALSAWFLRDEMFVPVFVGGLTMTGLLILADLPPSPEKFWEIALPSTLLVVLGVLSVHAERAFPVQEGPFSRRRFGQAFFWSGQALLGAGLFLLLGAQVAGDWLYQPLFQKWIYEPRGVGPSPIVGELRWLATALVLLATYTYLYSDIVVRQVGVYVHLAAFTLVWALMLVVQSLNLLHGIEAWICVLAVISLVINLAQARLFAGSPYTRALPFVAVLLPLVALGLGLIVYTGAIQPDFRSVWQQEPPSWGYLAGILLTAIACRVGAYVYGGVHPRLVAVYFFATAAATLTGAASVLAILGMGAWQHHAPILMLIPIAYLLAAQAYRGKSPERPLVWVAHTATVAMLLSSLASAQAGFSTTEGEPSLHLTLALFAAEAALFYGLAAVLRRQVAGVHLCAAMVCGSFWQLLTYAQVPAEYYTLAFALTGLALLIGYRLAWIDRFASSQVADAMFQAANTLLSLSFVSALFLSLSRLATEKPDWLFVGVTAILTLASLLAVALVRQAHWRRWYAVTTAGLGILSFVGMTLASELSAWQKLEIASIVAGVAFLVLGHIGWYREQDRENELTSLALLFGGLLVGVPLASATMIDRWNSEFRIANELGFLASGILLLTAGVLCRLKSTTLVGGLLTVVYFVTLLIYVPWGQLNTIALALTIGGGSLFGFGLVLSVFRERLLLLPQHVQRREGVFRVLAWR